MLEELRIVVRAFSTFLELANLAEDRQRRADAAARARNESHPLPVKESIRRRNRVAPHAQTCLPLKCNRY